MNISFCGSVSGASCGGEWAAGRTLLLFVGRTDMIVGLVDIADRRRKLRWEERAPLGICEVAAR